MAVAVGGIGVAVGGSGVGVSVGGRGVSVGGGRVAVGGRGVGVLATHPADASKHKARKIVSGIRFDIIFSRVKYITGFRIKNPRGISSHTDFPAVPFMT